MDRPSVYRARLARAVRVGAPLEVTERLRGEYHAAKQRDNLLSWLASDPQPTAEHRAALAALLVGGESVGAAA